MSSKASPVDPSPARAGVIWTSTALTFLTAIVSSKAVDPSLGSLVDPNPARAGGLWSYTRANSNLKISTSTNSNSKGFCLEDEISLGLPTREESSEPKSSCVVLGN